MGFANVRAIQEAVDLGQQNVFSWRKSPSQPATAGIWNDLSMTPGNPIPNYYAASPARAAALNGAEGLFHGSDVENVDSTFTVNISTDVITYPWDIPDGTRVTVTSTGSLPSGASPSGSSLPSAPALFENVTYHLQRLTSTTGKLCASAIDRSAGTAIDFNSAGSGTHRIRYASGKTKHLKSLTIMTNQIQGLPVTMYLMDYLLYYPFVEQGVAETQVMVNALPLPRYGDGAGVRMMAVMTNPQSTGSSTFTVSYTNQDGVSGRVTPILRANNALFAGGILTSAPGIDGCFGPFLPLQNTDTGVRSIESLSMVGSDVGLMALVLVRPLANIVLKETGAPVERDYVVDFPSAPRIRDGAYLNFITMQQATLASTTFSGLIQTVWN